jgi:MFS family permease
VLPRELISGPGLRLVTFGFLLSLFSSFGQTFFIALFGAEIRAEYGLSNGGFGALYSLANLASGLTMIWLGAVLDRTSLLRYAACATLALGAACVLMALAPSTILLALALFGLRLSGQGMLSHAAVTGMARAFQRSRGKAIALAALGHPAGEALLPIGAVGAVALLGWRGVWLGAAALLLAALLSLVALLARHGHWRQPARPAGATATGGSLRRRPAPRRRRRPSPAPTCCATAASICSARPSSARRSSSPACSSTRSRWSRPRAGNWRCSRRASPPMPWR